MKQRMTCAACRLVLAEYGAGTLPSEQRDLVETHLATCADCSQEFAAVRKLINMVSQPFQGDTPPPESFTHAMAQVRLHLQREASDNHIAARVVPPSAFGVAPPLGSKRHASPQYRYRSLRSAIAALTAVVLLVALAMFVFTQQPPRHTSGTQLAPSSTQLPSVTAAQLQQWELHAVAFATQNEGWAVGNTSPPAKYDFQVNHTPYVSPIVLHYQHGHWYQQSLPATLMTQSFVLTKVQMVSPTEGWAIGRTRVPVGIETTTLGVLLHYHDGQWTIVGQEFLTPLEQLAFVSPTDGWVIGDDDPQGTGALVLHYDGTTWTQIHDPAFGSVLLTTISVSGSADLWAAGMVTHGVGFDGNARSILLHYDGVRWTIHEMPTGEATGRITAIALSSPTAGWAVGTLYPPASASGGTLPNSPATQAIVLRYQNGNWTDASRIQGQHQETTFGWNDIALDAAANGWAVGTAGMLLHLSNAGTLTMTSATPPSQSATLEGVTLLSPNEGWAVGSPGVILHDIGGVWQRYQP